MAGPAAVLLPVTFYGVVLSIHIAGCGGTHGPTDVGVGQMDASHDGGIAPDAGDGGDPWPDGRLRCESALCRGYSCCPDRTNGAYCCGDYPSCDEFGCHCGSAGACPIGLFCCGDWDGAPPCTDRLTASLCAGM